MRTGHGSRLAGEHGVEVEIALVPGPEAGATGPDQQHGKDHEENGNGGNPAPIGFGPGAGETRFGRRGIAVAVTAAAATHRWLVGIFDKATQRLGIALGFVLAPRLGWLALDAATSTQPGHHAQFIGRCLV